MWQDNILAITNVFFGIGLFPMLVDKNKPTLLTSIPTAITLYVVTYTQYSLDLKLAAAGILVSALIWTILAIQKLKGEKRFDCI